MPSIILGAVGGLTGERACNDGYKYSIGAFDVDGDGVSEGYGGMCDELICGDGRYRTDHETDDGLGINPICEQCTEISNRNNGTTLTCTSETDSRIVGSGNKCNDGFVYNQGSGNGADQCIGEGECPKGQYMTGSGCLDCDGGEISNCLEGHTLCNTSGRELMCSKCQPHYHLSPSTAVDVDSGDGAERDAYPSLNDDEIIIAGSCDVNTICANDDKYRCSDDRTAIKLVSEGASAPSLESLLTGDGINDISCCDFTVCGNREYPIPTDESNLLSSRYRPDYDSDRVMGTGAGSPLRYLQDPCYLLDNSHSKALLHINDHPNGDDTFQRDGVGTWMADLGLEVGMQPLPVGYIWTSDDGGRPEPVCEYIDDITCGTCDVDTIGIPDDAEITCSTEIPGQKHGEPVLETSGSGMGQIYQPGGTPTGISQCLPDYYKTTEVGDLVGVSGICWHWKDDIKTWSVYSDSGYSGINLYTDLYTTYPDGITVPEWIAETNLQNKCTEAQPEAVCERELVVDRIARVDRIFLLMNVARDKMAAVRRSIN